MEVDKGKCKRCDMSTAGTYTWPEPSASSLTNSHALVYGGDTNIPIVTASAVVAQPFGDVGSGISGNKNQFPIAVAQAVETTSGPFHLEGNTIMNAEPGLRFQDGEKWGTYHGNIIRQKRHGYGKIQYDDGSSYEGEWHWNKFHGRGTLRYATGPILQCETFSMGEIEGGATYYYPDGKTDLRMYKHGNVVGEGVQWDKDGRSIFKLNKGRRKEQIDAGKAARIASRLGLRVPSTER